MTTEDKQPKIKLSILVEVEYEPEKDYYPEGSSLQEMLNIDVEGTKEDPFISMNHGSAKWTITGEIV